MKVLITDVEYPDIELERSVLESAGFGVELAQLTPPALLSRLPNLPFANWEPLLPQVLVHFLHSPPEESGKHLHNAGQHFLGQDLNCVQAQQIGPIPFQPVLLDAAQVRCTLFRRLA